MTRILSDIALSLALLCGSVYLWFAADGFQRFARYKGIDSDFWPKILLVLVAVLAAVQAYQQVRTLLVLRTTCYAPEGGEGVALNWRKLVLAAALVVMYFVGLQTVGFMLATVLFLLFAIHLVGYANRTRAMLYPFVFTAAVTVIFVKALELPLPRGMGVFEAFSRMFY